MVKKCDICDKNYIEENDDICISCAVNIEIENDVIENYFVNESIENISDDKLNDNGVSVKWAE